MAFPDTLPSFGANLANFTDLTDAKHINDLRAAVVDVATVVKDSLSSYPGSLQDLLNFPAVGKSVSSRLQADTSTGPLPPPENQSGPKKCTPLLYLGAGNSGVVRQVWCVHGGPTGWGTDLRKLHVKVWVDSGEIADITAPDDDHLLVDIPYASLLGGQLHDSAPATTRMLMGERLRATYKPGGLDGDYVGLELMYPMPFSNGILILIGVQDGATFTPVAWDEELGPQIFGQVQYELGDLPAGLSSYRFKAKYATGTYTYPTGISLASEATGRGFSVAEFFALHTPGQAAWEDNWRFQTDMAATDYAENSGTEDLFGLRATYYFVDGTFQDETDGIWAITLTPHVLFEGYHFFHHDFRRWVNGFEFKKLMTVSNESPQIAHSLFLYYHGA